MMHKGQSHIHSILESFSNVAIGYGVAVTANLLVLPLFGYDVSAGDAAGIGFVMTVISLIRSYTLRRFFNKIHLQQHRDYS